MSDNSKIEWTDATWNPVTGCTKVSPGCDHCYAERIVERFKGKGSFAVVQRSEEKLFAPMKWRTPRMVFVNSMSDLFHDDVPDSFIAHVFSVMARTPQHTYQLLTKRHGRMRALLNRPSFRDNLAHWSPTWPLPNLWLGVSVENQQWADIRVPALLDTPAAVRWLSCEPLLGPVDLSRWLLPVDWPACWEEHAPTAECSRCIRPDWVVVGGESGPAARAMHPAWARSLRDHCFAVGVPFFFKQWGEWAPESMWVHGDNAAAAFVSSAGRVRRLVDGKPTEAPMARGEDVTMRRAGKKAAGRLLDGRTWNEYPGGGR